MENKKIYGANMIDLALVVDNNLIISDLHLGYEQALNAEVSWFPDSSTRRS